VSPSSVSSFPATANVTVNAAGLVAGPTQLSVQGVSGSKTHTLVVPFNVADYQISGSQTLSAAPGGQVTAKLTFSASPFYSGEVNATCDATALSGTQCTLSPPNPIAIGIGASVPLSASINVPNDATPGTYNININTQDVTGAPSHTFTITLTINQDFTIGALTPATQTITAGQSASYNFSVLPVGASFTNAVNLSCSGGPVVSLCTFTPNPVTPGGNSAAVVLQITTTSNSASLAPRAPVSAVLLYSSWLALPALALLARRRRSKLAPLSLLGLLLLALLLPSCGGGGSNGGGGGTGQGTQPGTYTIAVTGASGTLSHQAASTVTLIVQ